MRVPLSWLGEFVELPESVTPEQVHADLVRVGFEEEDIRRFDVSGPVVVGEVLSREPEEHSNGKTVNWCQVRVAPEGQQAADGGADVRGIVCGAHNFEAGDRVVVSLPGAVLPGGFEISARKTYGHVSDGMIASARELTLGDDHDGIIVLSRFGIDAEPGADAKALLGLDQSAVEINVTPDRGYAFSIRGVAREVSHSTGAAFSDPAAAVTPATGSGFPVVLDDREPIRGRAGATGFIARTVRGIDQSRPTPAWMVARLQLAGIRSLSLEVDISNYVMLELGQPLHAYDLAKLDGGITVRRAAPGETLLTLDGAERKLHVEDLVITDGSGVVGLAGVMGGESTKVTETTSDVLIEAATFDSVSIARTSRRHKLPSEASKRFERGVDPLVARAAAQRMVDLLVELAGGTADELGAELVAPWDAPEIRLPLARVNGLMGADYTDAEARTAIEMIGCTVTDGAAGELVVTPPSWRSDLTRPADLVEEVARVVGYDRIPSVLPVAPPGRGLTRAQRLRRRAANVVTAAGLDEVQSYPFVTRAQLDDFGAGAEPVVPVIDGVAQGDAAQAGPVAAVKLANPLDGEAPFMRRSLLAGLVTAAQRNVSRGLTDLALVEFGAVFEPRPELGTAEVPPLAEKPASETLDELYGSVPAQPRRAAGLLIGDAVAKQAGEAARAIDWADALDAARIVAGAVSAELVVTQGAHRAFHPGRTAELSVRVDDGLEPVGVAGELLPELVAEYHLPGRVAAFELDLDRLIELAPREPETHPLSTYPAATQDLTLVVGADIPAGDVLAVVTAGAGELLEGARIVDDYRGTGIPEGQKALTFALRFRATDRTLKAEEASAAKLLGVAAAELAFDAKLRD
ncbi:phenylalanine--tRNA ligase subunit beta [Leucobacter luti]|uniref:Phenylalanine--tRNA ligase beta subunit n=1 Tax=Leucobacter luti TaxID=340320 RepID=A0A4Q7TX32_9MICO|nr:phenylalanine--tRNA ligase subunit beta [Leucobacter luti]MBL3698433.1 phenylalanine--tRNA ligase subunit beta [Leucobacter luti]RZT64478.1 phenylalanyl-tRNA synthetase beta subunit [Leucobacter luti]